MKTDEFKNKTEGELLKMLKEKRKKVQDLRMALSSSKVKNQKELMQTRKDIARILTILNK